MTDIRNVHQILEDVRAGREATIPLDKVEERLGLTVTSRKVPDHPSPETASPPSPAPTNGQ
jgi:hypothetical protein